MAKGIIIKILNWLMIILSLAFYLYFFWGIEFIYFIIIIDIYLLILYGVYVIYKKIRKRNYINLIEFAKKCYIKFSWITISLLIFLSIFVYYFNVYSPTPTPLYVLSNGKKQVMFQTIMHIGTDNYYQSIRNWLEKAKIEGYTLFYEGVKIDDKEKVEKFNTVLGVNFSADFYENFSKLYGLKNQKNDMFLNVVNDKDINVDIPISQIVNIYESKYGEIILENDKIIDINQIMIKRLADLNTNQLFLLRHFFQGSINFMTRYDGLKNFIVKILKKDRIIDVILEERNNIIANEIINSDVEKIFILYGKLHFQGVFDRLKSYDKNRKIVGEVMFYPTK